MKRVKIMLMSLTLLAIVGGALAFKAKFQAEPYCTTYTTSIGSNHGNLTSCPSIDDWSTTDVIDDFVTTYYTTLPDGGDCKKANNLPVACGPSTVLTTEIFP